MGIKEAFDKYIQSEVPTFRDKWLSDSEFLKRDKHHRVLKMIDYNLKEMSKPPGEEN